jgi:hypothetical protein
MTIRGRGVAAAIGLCAIVAVIAEGSSLLFWVLIARERIPYHLHRDIETELSVSRPAKHGANIGFDADLGWHPVASSEIFDDAASRRTSERFGAFDVAAYGDSFVFGAGVADDETFSFLLSAALQTGVRNYGVGGYGPDQAVLRLERHMREGHRRKIVILGMPSENIARVINIFFGLYIPVPEVTPEFVKPLFVREGERWTLLNAVPVRLGATTDLVPALAFARDHDFWYDQNEKRPRLEFPYLLTTIQAVRFFGWQVVRWQDLYGHERALATLH